MNLIEALASPPGRLAACWRWPATDEREIEHDECDEPLLNVTQIQ